MPRCAGLLSASFLLLALSAWRSCAAGVPNVLLIVVDDLRPELEAYGYNQSSPNIANFAKGATLFKSAYCQFSLCSPSRASFLTGRRPDTTQVYDLHHYFRDTPGLRNVVTMPQFFKNNGYRVAGGGKIFHPGAASGNDDDAISWTEPYYHSPNARQFGGNSMSWQARSDPELDFPDAQIATNAIQQMQSLKNGPFFIAVGFHKPHLPFVFPSAYLNRYPAVSEIPLANFTSPPANMPRIAWSNYAELKAYQDIASLNLRSRPGDWMPVTKAQELRRAYWAATSFADAQVGRVLQELDTLGLRHNTTVVIMSDHGWHLGDLGEWAKMTNFEPANRVVLVVRDPSRPSSAGQTVDANVELLDVYPTLVDIANFSIPSGLQGKSLTPLLNSPAQLPPRWEDLSFSQALRSSAMSQTTPSMGYTFRTRDWRYTEWLAYNATTKQADWFDVTGVELYDHRGDAKNVFGYYERSNLGSDAQYGNLRLQLSAMLQRQRTVSPVVAPTSPSTTTRSGNNAGHGSSGNTARGSSVFSFALAIAAWILIKLL